MQQSEANEARHKQIISQEAEEAITLSQNHSRQVAERFYQVRNLSDASILAARTHEQLYGVQAIPQISREEDEEYLPEEEKEIEEIEESPKRKRVAWSAEEEAWIISWLKKYVVSPHFNSKINWRMCLKDLLESDEHSIFSKEHQDPTKIMECVKRIAKRESKNLGDLVKDMIHLNK